MPMIHSPEASAPATLTLARSPAARFAAAAIAALAFAAFIPLGCSETTHYYECQGDAQCAMARACERECEDEYGEDRRCARFSTRAPSACGAFVGLPARLQESRMRIKRDP